MAKSKGNISKTPLIVLTLICVMLAILWGALKYGISLDRIAFMGIIAENVHIKENQGLNISINRLLVEDRQTSDTSLNPGPIISRFNSLTFLIREIEIREIHQRDQTYSLLFQDDLFTVSGETFRLKGELKYENREVRMNISQLELKPYSARLAGTALFIPGKQRVEFTGSFNTPDISGDLILSYQQDLLSVTVTSDDFSDLDNILKQFPIGSKTLEWISENISASTYTIEEIQARIPFREGKPYIRPENFTGKAVATEATVRFHPSLPSIMAEQVSITYQNNQLSFKLGKPRYKTKDLSGSSVLINNLITGETSLDINIQTETRFDEDIHEILETYSIDIPVTQFTGTTKADLHLTFDFPGFDLHTNGNFTTSAGQWETWDISIVTSGADVRLQDNLVIFDNAACAYKDMLKGSFIGNIDIAAKTAMFSVDVERFELTDREKNVFLAKNVKNTPVKIDFSSEEISVHLPKQQLDFILAPSKKTITAHDIIQLKPYIPFLEKFPVMKGNLSFDITDRDNLQFLGSLKTNFFPIFFDNKQVTEFTFSGLKKNDQFSADINEGKISLTLDKNKLSVRLLEYVFMVDTEVYSERTQKGAPLTSPVSISGPRSIIQSEKLTILTKQFQADIKDQKIMFAAVVDQGKIFFNSDSKGMNLIAKDIDAELAQDFFPFADLEGGRFNLTLSGKDENRYEGFVEFSDVLIQDAALLNNILSFLNAVPALATFSSPGFDRDGYRIKQGIVNFSMDNGLVTIHNLRTDGTTINIEAGGWVDLNNDLIDMEVKLISLKDYSKIISKIPLAGYVILGKDGSLSTLLNVNGKRSSPEIKTNLSKEILLLPINVVKRTVTWPLRVFESVKDLVTEIPAQ